MLSYQNFKISTKKITKIERKSLKICLVTSEHTPIDVNLMSILNYFEVNNCILNLFLLNLFSLITQNFNLSINNFRQFYFSM